MNASNLRALVVELERELAEARSLDESSRQSLRTSLDEIRAVLDRGEGGDGDADLSPLPQRLSTSVEKFEATHPGLTGIVSRLIDGLAEMGI